ncbi:MAG TPA: 30S ribosomal protein S16 [Acidimicrobiales bacterium]|nr:30S ribosomal protein S16 [Acidimicrobiales bacterium]
MAVKLRLMRMGKKKQPVYRIVAADSRSPRDGRFIEILGTYEPRNEPSRVVVDNEKVARWLRDGAKPTDTVARLLAESGVSDESKAGAAQSKS